MLIIQGVDTVEKLDLISRADLHRAGLPIGAVAVLMQGPTLVLGLRSLTSACRMANINGGGHFLGAVCDRPGVARSLVDRQHLATGCQASSPSRRKAGQRKGLQEYHRESALG